MEGTPADDPEYIALARVLREYEVVLEFLDGDNGYHTLTEETANLW